MPESSFTAEEGCPSCAFLQKKLNGVKEDSTAKFLALKKKIISTDMLIKKYKDQSMELTSIKSNLDSAVMKIKLKDKELETVESTLKHAKTELETHKVSNLALERRSKQLQCELYTARDQLQGAECCKAQLSVKCNSFEKQYEDEKVTVADLRRRLNSRNLNKVSSLEEKLDKAKKTISRQKEQIKTIRSLRKQIKDLKRAHHAELMKLGKKSKTRKARSYSYSSSSESSESSDATSHETGRLSEVTCTLSQSNMTDCSTDMEDIDDDINNDSDDSGCSEVAALIDKYVDSSTTELGVSSPNRQDTSHVKSPNQKSISRVNSSPQGVSYDGDVELYLKEMTSFLPRNQLLSPIATRLHHTPLDQETDSGQANDAAHPTPMNVDFAPITSSKLPAVSVRQKEGSSNQAVQSVAGIDICENSPETTVLPDDNKFQLSVSEKVKVGRRKRAAPFKTEPASVTTVADSRVSDEPPTRETLQRRVSTSKPAHDSPPKRRSMRRQSNLRNMSTSDTLDPQSATDTSTAYAIVSNPTKTSSHDPIAPRNFSKTPVNNEIIPNPAKTSAIDNIVPNPTNTSDTCTMSPNPMKTSVAGTVVSSPTKTSVTDTIISSPTKSLSTDTIEQVSQSLFIHAHATTSSIPAQTQSPSDSSKDVTDSTVQTETSMNLGPSLGCGEPAAITKSATRSEVGSIPSKKSGSKDELLTNSNNSNAEQMNDCDNREVSPHPPQHPPSTKDITSQETTVSSYNLPDMRADESWLPEEYDYRKGRGNRRYGQTKFKKALKQSEKVLECWETIISKNKYRSKKDDSTESKPSKDNNTAASIILSPQPAGIEQCTYRVAQSTTVRPPTEAESKNHFSSASPCSLHDRLSVVSADTDLKPHSIGVQSHNSSAVSQETRINNETDVEPSGSSANIGAPCKSRAADIIKINSGAAEDVTGSSTEQLLAHKTSPAAEKFVSDSVKLSVVEKSLFSVLESSAVKESSPLEKSSVIEESSSVPKSSPEQESSVVQQSFPVQESSGTKKLSELRELSAIEKSSTIKKLSAGENLSAISDAVLDSLPVQESCAVEKLSASKHVVKKHSSDNGLDCRSGLLTPANGNNSNSHVDITTTSDKATDGISESHTDCKTESTHQRNGSRRPALTVDPQLFPTGPSETPASPDMPSPQSPTCLEPSSADEDPFSDLVIDVPMGPCVIPVSPEECDNPHVVYDNSVQTVQFKQPELINLHTADLSLTEHTEPASVQPSYNDAPSSKESSPPPLRRSSRLRKLSDAKGSPEMPPKISRRSRGSTSNPMPSCATRSANTTPSRPRKAQSFTSKSSDAAVEKPLNACSTDKLNTCTSSDIVEIQPTSDNQKTDAPRTDPQPTHPKAVDPQPTDPKPNSSTETGDKLPLSKRTTSSRSNGELRHGQESVESEEGEVKATEDLNATPAKITEITDNVTGLSDMSTDEDATEMSSDEEELPIKDRLDMSKLSSGELILRVFEALSLAPPPTLLFDRLSPIKSVEEKSKEQNDSGVEEQAKVVDECMPLDAITLVAPPFVPGMAAARARNELAKELARQSLQKVNTITNKPKPPKKKKSKKKSVVEPPGRRLVVSYQEDGLFD